MRTGWMCWLLVLAACGGKDDGVDTQDTPETGETGETIETAETGDTEPTELPCTGATADGSGVYACVRVDSTQKASIHERVAGFNLSIKNHGFAIWDNRVIDVGRKQMTGHVRFPDVGYVGNWKSGQLERDWILRFESDDVCDPADANACTDEFNLPGEVCAPQPTAAHPDSHQCQRLCTVATEAQDCESGEICMFGQCALSCVGEADETTCEVLDTHEENGQTVQNKVQRNRECAKGDDGRYGCVGSKVNNYLGYEEVVSGKGFSTLGDFVRYTESVGAQLLVHANTMTDSPESAYELANELIDRQVDVGAWLLALETFYFRSPNAPPTFWLGGAEYGADMERYITEIKRAYSERGVEVPLITLSFSDHENDWQSVWDVGKDQMVDPNGSDNQPGLGDYIAANGRSFTASDFHWYPGKASTDFSEAEVLVNLHLPNYAVQHVDDYFLPLSCADNGGVCDDPDDPKITVTEFNIQTTWSSGLAAVHASEFMMRLSDHPRVAILGFHSLIDGCMDVADNHRYSAKYATRYNVYGTFDSNVVDASNGSQTVQFGEVTSLSCLALGLVNRTINTSEYAYTTSVEADDLPDDPNAVFADDTGITPTPAESPKLYAKAFESEREDVLIFTNRSDVPHTVTPYWDGQPISRSGALQALSAEAPENRNCFESGDPVGDGEVCAEIALSPEESWEPGQPVEVPAWGVVRLALPRVAGSLDAVSNLVVEAGPRSATVRFSPVDGATSYDVRYGVTGSDHNLRKSVDAAGCDAGECVLSLSNLAHEVAHSLSVTAVADSARGAVADPVSFTPTRVELFTGLWGTPVGDATWTEDQGVLQTDGGSQASLLPMVDASGNGLALEDYSVEAQFRTTGCSCDPDIGTSSYTGTEEACGRFGIGARYGDEDNYLMGYLEHKPGYGCYYRISRKVDDGSIVLGDVLNRSPYLDVTIEQSPGITRTDKWGNPAYPDIPGVADGQWHTLQMSVDEQVVRVWLDGRLIASSQDTYLLEGTVALFSRREAVEWRNFSVWEAPW